MQGEREVHQLFDQGKPIQKQNNIYFLSKYRQKNMRYPGIFCNINVGSDCVFTTNNEHSLDEPVELVKDQLNQTTNSYRYNKVDKFSKETSKKNATDKATLIRTNKEND